MSKKFNATLLLLCLIFALSCALVACSSTQYTLTFDTVGGVADGETAVTFKEGGKVTPPTVTKQYFTFAGWYADGNYTTEFTNFDNLPAEDVTVYAKWTTKASGRFVFETNGGSQVDSLFGICGEQVTPPTAPTKEGYVFAGWCEDENLTRLYTFNTFPDCEKTLFAKWQQNTANYAYVTFDLNGVKTEVAVTKGQTVAMPTAEENQPCVWYTDANKTIPYNFDASVIANTTLYGVICTDGLTVKGSVVTGYTGSEEKVFIPETYNGVKITSIGASAFAGNNTVMQVYLPTSVTTIGNNAFYNCQYMETVNLTSAVTNLGQYAFANCQRLDVALDLSGLTVIPVNAFSDCKFVSQVTLGQSLTKIDEYAFANCQSLATINLPHSVQTINKFAFANTAISKVAIPNSLTTCQEGVFKGCRVTEVAVDSNTTFTVANNGLYTNNGATLILYFGLEEDVVVDSSVTAVAPYAFCGSNVATLEVKEGSALTLGSLYGMQSLQSLKIADLDQTNSYLAYFFGAPTMQSNATSSLYVPLTLTTVEFTNFTATQTSDYAFYGCIALTNVVGIANQTKIGSYAYAYTSLTSFNVDSTVQEVATTAFHGATCLTDISVAETNPVYASYEGGLYNKEQTTLLIYPAGKTDATFASTMTKIGEQAFYKSAVVEVEVPNTVETIAFGAFEKVTALKKITVPFIGGGDQTNQYMAYIFGTEVRYNADTVQAAYSADKYPATLTEITLSNPVTQIPDCAFMMCKSLVVLNNDATVTSIGNYAFYGTMLDSDLVIPESVQTIGAFAYASSQRVVNLVIGKGVTTIGFAAFAEITTLQSITFEEGTNDLVIGEEAFRANYEETNYGFEGLSYLQSVTISSNVVSIGYMAFGFGGAYGADYTQFVPLVVTFAPNSRLKEVGPMAFAFTSLVSLTLPDTVETIGAMAFFNCANLTTFTVGSKLHQATNLALIDDGAFAGCISLTKVYLHKSVTSVDQVPVLGAKTDASTKDYDVFYNIEPKIYVPADSVDIYKTTWPTLDVVSMGGK